MERIVADIRGGTGPETVIVLHDWLGSAATWEPILPYLDTDRFTFVFAEARGYGASIEMTGAYTTAEIASDVFALADSRGAESFHLVGHSMTGMAGFAALAAPEGERIESYIAVAPVPPGGYPADEATRDFFAAIPRDPEVTQNAFDGLTGGRYEGTRWAEVRTAHNLATSSQAAMRGYGDMIYEDLSARLAEAAPETPVLVVTGAHDFPPMRADALEVEVAPLAPNSRVVAIDGRARRPNAFIWAFRRNGFSFQVSAPHRLDTHVDPTALERLSDSQKLKVLVLDRKVESPCHALHAIKAALTDVRFLMKKAVGIILRCVLVGDHPPSLS